MSDAHYPSFRPRPNPEPRSWTDLLKWSPGSTDPPPWLSQGDVTKPGGILDGAAFLYCDAKDVRVRFDDPGPAYRMVGNAAILKGGKCLECNVPLTADGEETVETLIVADI